MTFKYESQSLEIPLAYTMSNRSQDKAFALFKKSCNKQMQKNFIDACRNDCIAGAKWLLESWPAINIHDNNEAAFHEACCYGNLKIAQWLWEIAPDINVHIRAEAAFRESCNNNHLNVVKWLLQIAPDINIAADGDAAFFTACRLGRLEIAQLLLQIAPDTITRTDNNDAFRKACNYGYLEMAEWLLQVAPDINVHDKTFCDLCNVNKITFSPRCFDITGINDQIDNLNRSINWLVDIAMYSTTRYIFHKHIGYIVNPVEPIKKWQVTCINDCYIYSNGDPDLEMLQLYMDNTRTAKSAKSIAHV